MATKFTSAEEVRAAIVNAYKSLEDTVNNLVSKTDFRVGGTYVGCDRSNVELVIYTDPDEKEPSRLSSLNLYLEEDIFETGKGQQFKTNIGTTGEFSLEDTSKGSRANFYIQVGKVLGDSELLDNIKNALIAHSTAINELRKQWQKLNKKEA